MNDRDKELAVQSELMRKYNYAYSKELQEFANLIRADERDIWAKDADWCIQNHLEHLIPERIRARGNT